MHPVHEIDALYALDDQCIIAQCTPKGSGAIALLRLAGINAIEIATLISKITGNKKLLSVPSHTIHYGWVINQNDQHIDQVLFMVMHGPKTFTGQNTVEITCHNNPFIIEQIIEQAIVHGGRLAQEGEFTKRAVLNNKIDLVQAEAINELIHANTQMSLKQSLSQLEGSLSDWITKIETELVKALAFCEASFEFIDEDMTFGERIKQIINDSLGTIGSIKKTFNQQQQIRQGIRIAIIGSVNAGKSSLFNALLDKERAIVTNIAGTTRDAVEAGLYKSGNYWTLIDTAGLRQTDDIVEKKGIARSFEEGKKADIILLVFDGSSALTKQEKTVYQNLVDQYKTKIIPVCNKIDLANATSNQTHHMTALKENFINVSSKNKTNILIIENTIQKKIDTLFAQADSPFLLNQRQFNLLLHLEQKLNQINSLLSNHTIEYEIVSYHINDALTDLSELTGKTISEKGMDAVFREFCVGK